MTPTCRPGTSARTKLRSVNGLYFRGVRYSIENGCGSFETIRLWPDFKQLAFLHEERRGWIGCSKRMPDVSTNGRGMRWGARRRIEGAESRLVLGRCDDGVVGGSDRRLAG